LSITQRQWNIENNVRMHGFPNRRLAAVVVVTLGAAVTISCGESPTAAVRFGQPATLQIITGNRQTGVAGQTLAEPLTVQVLDLAGHALPGVTVLWSLASGNGALFARAFPTRTDSAGLVLVFWQLGTPLGDQQVTAQCGQLPSVVFTAHAQIPPSQRVTLISGSGQQDTVRATLAQPLVIRVLKADSTPDVGAPVAWRAISRGSTYSPADTQTDAQGQASTSWTLGTVAGLESTAVFVAGLPPVVIVASTFPGAPARIAITPGAFPVLGLIGDTVGVSASAWDRYDNPFYRVPVIGAADTTIAQPAGGYDGVVLVQARHHGSTFVTAQIDALRDSVPLTVLGFKGVSVGGSNICGVSLTDDTYCWGLNTDGGVGDGTRIERTRPVLIGAGLGLQLPSTDWHTCALDSSGHAFCWGYGAEGQLGDGSADFATESRQLLPVPVAGGRLFSSIRSGRRHTCAIAINDDAFCWGGNWSGQLGRDTITSTCYGGTARCSDWPILVAGGLQFANVTASVWDHSCGVTTSGDAYCWGSNASGQLGSDSATSMCDPSSPAPCNFTPLHVEGGITFTSVSAGDYYTCGLGTSGDGYCWGYGYYGQLGNGAFDNSTVPVKVTGGLSFVDVQAAPHEACGLTTDGKLYCWGSFVATPALVQPNLVFTSFALGTEGGSTRACALTPDNDLYCWYQAIF
jgi:alpha-tubulin suppressor-like RCC1 family protein